MDDIKDIKAPVYLPFDFREDLWWLWILLAVLALAVAIYFFVIKRKESATVEIVPVLASWEIALKRLDVLSLKNYPSQGLWRPYYEELSGILRHYIEDRYGLKAPEMTTEEFLNKVKYDAGIPEKYKEITTRFLNTCDMVKFAKSLSNPEEARSSFELVLQFIDETKC